MLAIDTLGNDCRIRRALFDRRWFLGLTRLCERLSWNHMPRRGERGKLSCARCEKKTLAGARGLALQSIDGITT